MKTKSISLSRFESGTNSATVSLFVLGLATVMTASGQTVVPLNTGYNHQIFTPYPTPTSTTSTTNDNYWINIASYPPTAPSVGASWVLRPTSPWAAPLPATNWISARNVTSTPTGTSDSNPAYTIFRKCFCLLPNFKNASLSFRVRGDDNIQVWFNSVVNVALAPASGNCCGGSPLASVPSNPKWFKVGKNCIYVLVEDTSNTGGMMGFDMVGSIQADGLAPLPASGVEQTFGCPCASPVLPGGAGVQARITDSDQGVINELVKVAEERRLSRLRRTPQR